MLALRYAVIAFAIVAMLWPSVPPKARGGLSGTDWKVVEIDGTKRSGAGTLRFTQTSVRGKAACNSFAGAFRETEGGIEIGGLNATRMACAGRMELEQALFSTLERARGYRADGSSVLLLDAQGKPIARLAE
jgi:heat shock protein HslJ